MKYTLLFLAIGISLLLIPKSIPTPSQNGATPGCEPCHSLQDGMVSVSATDLQVQVTVSGTSGKVAGELVDGSGTVVSVVNSTNSNPFTLTAPGPGEYRINAGHKSPLVWDSSMVTISLTNVGENESNPNKFELYNNYPNPFNPSTTIRYSIPEASFTSIKIYDALGNQVSSLVNETKTAGTYEVTFDAKNLSSGIYYYELQAGSFTQTKKMILTK